MKRILAINYWIILLSMSASFAAEMVDPVKSFENLIQQAKRKTTTEKPVYFNKIQKKWAKQSFEVHNIEYDVKPNNSLVFPALGIVSFDVYSTQSKLFIRKTDAEATNKFELNNGENVKHHIVSIRYRFKPTGWIFSSADIIHDFSNPLMEDIAITVTEDKILREPNAIPYAAILFWLK